MFMVDNLFNGNPKPKDMPKSSIGVKFEFEPEPSTDNPVFSYRKPAL